MSDYIYLRNKDGDYLHNDKQFIKLGETNDLIGRDEVYATGEHIRGNYVKIFQLLNMDSKKCEKILKNMFKKYHKYIDAGTEFYEYIIVDLIEETLTELHIKYKPVNIDDIERQIKDNTYKRKLVESIPLLNNLFMKMKEETYIPKLITEGKRKVTIRDYQQEGKDLSVEHYREHDKGILNWVCGLGKTYESLYISTDYLHNHLLIGIYRKNLASQWINAILKFYKNYPILLVGSFNKIEIEDELSQYICDESIIKNVVDKITTTTNVKNIKQWYDTYDKGITISMYASSNKLKGVDIVYDFSILDECHHLSYWLDNIETGDDKKRNTDILDLQVKKQLGLTATMKKIDNDNTIDNYNERYFGKIIDNKSLTWAIDNGYLCDYDINILKMNIDEIEDMISQYEDIPKDDYYYYLSAYISLLTFMKYPDKKKLLIYANRIEDTIKIKKYIELLISGTSEFYELRDKLYRADINCDTPDKSKKIKEFLDSELGIIISVYIFGEGIDIPILDGVIFSDNMSSRIRILQSASRPFRLNPSNLSKKALLIIPTIFEDDDSSSYAVEEDDLKIKTFGKIMDVVSEMGTSDKNVMDKVKAIKLRKKEDKDEVKENNYEIFDDIQFDREIKMRIIRREALGRNTLPYLRKRIKSLGGRTDYTRSCEDDYIKNKHDLPGLLDYDTMKDILRKRNSDWLSLYSVDTTKYIKWAQFNTEWNNKSSDDYTDHTLNNNTEGIYPYYSDLEELYGVNGYNRNFWNTDNAEEF